MEKKYYFAKILGEMYRLMNTIAPENYQCKDTTIFGLIEGIEEVVDREFYYQINPTTNEEIAKVINVLNEHCRDKEKFNRFKGFYDIEEQLNQEDIDRGKASHIITYLYNNGMFAELIEKMDSNNSPTECRRFDLPDEYRTDVS